VEKSNVFAGAYVERHAHLRNDAEWLKDAAAGSAGVFVAVRGQQCLATEEPLRAALLERHQVDAYVDDDELIFLGMFRQRPAFAVRIDPDHHSACADFGQFHDLRYLGSVLPSDEANLVAHARALVAWNEVQKFCGQCGAPTRAESGGNTRVCTRDSCAARLFPRVDPAIIVLVHDGERCLLGRQANWPEGRYSTIAGFVEPGESLEDAVVREVHEETNIRVGAVRYHSSQPWPFPASLMLGFTADAQSDSIVLNDGELEAAQWFTRKELMSGYPKLSPRLSISRRLIDGWIEHAGERATPAPDACA